MQKGVSCKRVVAGCNYPDAGTVNFHLLLLIQSDAFSASEKAKKTLEFFKNKMKEYSSQVLAVSVDQMQSSESEPFSLAKDLSNFSELSKKIRNHALANRSCLVLDIFDEMIESEFGSDTITLKKERNYPDEKLKFREGNRPSMYT